MSDKIYGLYVVTNHSTDGKTSIVTALPDFNGEVDAETVDNIIELLEKEFPNGTYEWRYILND